MILYLHSNRPKELPECIFDQKTMMWTYHLNTLEELKKLLANPKFSEYCISYNTGRFYFDPCDWYGG